MSTLIFIGPLSPEEIFRHADDGDGFLLEFRPFRRNSINEADARSIQRSLPSGRRRPGIFDTPPIAQLLYLLSEELITDALISHIGERELHRLTESFPERILAEGTCKPREVIQREQRLPIAGHFFGNIPDEDVLSILNKPYLLSMEAIDETEDNAALLRRYPPFALWCGDPAKAKAAAAWLKTF